MPPSSRTEPASSAVRFRIWVSAAANVVTRRLAPEDSRRCQCLANSVCMCHRPMIVSGAGVAQGRREETSGTCAPAQSELDLLQSLDLVAKLGRLLELEVARL